MSKKEWLEKCAYIFVVVGILLMFFGFIHMVELDKTQVIPKQDLEIHHFQKFGKSLTITATACLTPDYNLIYSFEETPLKLELDFKECDNCPELENGLTFWFFYEKVNGSGSGGSIMSYSPDDFYHINIKPGEKIELEGWVKFTGEGVYRHVLRNATHHIRLESTEKTFTVYANHIAYQIRSNRVIESFSNITAGTSFIMLAFICFQSCNNIENRTEQKKEFKKLLSKLNQIKKIIDKDQPKNNKTKDKKKRK